MSRVIHFEIPANEPEKLSAFYAAAFGWAIKKWDGPQDYWTVRTGDDDCAGINGGLMRRSEMIQGPVNTIRVDSLDASIAAVEQNGGALIGERLPIPGIGFLAYARDPEGNLFGMMQIDAKAGTEQP